MNFLDKVSFHTIALAKSFAEAGSDALTGVVNLVTEDAPKKTADYHRAAKASLGSTFADVTAPLAYLTHITVIPTGEAIGTGAAMTIYGKNGEEKAMGAATLVAGTCAAVGMAAGVFAPKPVIAIPTFSTLGSDGALALGAVSVAVDAPAVGGVATAAAINGGTVFMIGDEDGVAGREPSKDEYLELDDAVEKIIKKLGLEENVKTLKARLLRYDDSLTLLDTEFVIRRVGKGHLKVDVYHPISDTPITIDITVANTKITSGGVTKNVRTARISEHAEKEITASPRDVF